MHSVVIILKVTERCNINCSYCYFFNGVDKSFINHTPRMSLEVVKDTAIFLKNACIENQIKRIRIDFHGGEPLLLKRSYFAKICEIFIEYLDAIAQLEFTLQTNGMLINEEWIQIFHYYKINIGISIDGPAEYHNKYRVNHQGLGTYKKTRQAIDMLREFYRRGSVNFGIGVLCVINPEFSAKKIYRHFVDDLKLNSFDFLLPDNTWDSIDRLSFKSEQYGRFLCELFEEWIKDNNPRIYIRIINSIINKFIGGFLHYHDFGGWLDNFLLITISSEGAIGPDDTYRSVNPHFMDTGLTVADSKFSDLLQHTTFQSLIKASQRVSRYCLDCNWQNICKSGSLLHRYSSGEEFQKQSVYCDGLKMIFKTISEYVELNKAYKLSKGEIS